MGTVLIAVAAAGAAGVISLAWRWAFALAEVTRGLGALGARVRGRPIPIAARGPAGRLVKIFHADAPRAGGPSPGGMFVYHDVTELRRLERMRQDFVANASHELKTPLASIKAYTETLLDWALHDETVNTRFLERIDEQVERLNQLILDLLSLARLESGQEIFDHRPLSGVPVLESCAEGDRDRASRKHLAVTFDPGDLT